MAGRVSSVVSGRGGLLAAGARRRGAARARARAAGSDARVAELVDALAASASRAVQREIDALVGSFAPFASELEDIAAGRPVGGFEGAASFPPVAPGSQFGVGHAAAFGDNTLAFLDTCAAMRAPVVGMRFRNRPAVLLTTPELATRVFAEPEVFGRGAGGGGGQGQRRSFVGRGLIASEGELWKRQRKVIQPSFGGVERYAPTFVRAADDATAGWRDGAAVDVHRTFMDLTMDIACQTLFSADVRGEQAELGQAIGDVFNAAADSTRRTLFFLPQWVTLPSEASYDRAYDLLAGYLDSLVATRRAEPSGTEYGDLLGALMEARDEDGNEMEASLLRDEMMTLFVAGHETTALALTWACSLLAKHPAALAKALAEVDAALPDGRAPTAADVGSMPFMRGVVLESLRLRPPAFLNFRSLREDTEAAGWKLEEGMFVMVSPYLLHRDASVWGADADDFRPERWDGMKPSGPAPGAFLPFGGGVRTCVGAGFALLEAQLVLAAILREWAPDSIAELPPADPAVTLRPRDGSARLCMRRRRRAG